jgi:hypothetical protein
MFFASKNWLKKAGSIFNILEGVWEGPQKIHPLKAGSYHTGFYERHWHDSCQADLGCLYMAQRCRTLVMHGHGHSSIVIYMVMVGVYGGGARGSQKEPGEPKDP